MSESHTYRVPEELHPLVEKAWMEFRSKNPILSMGSDGRLKELRRLRRCLKDKGHGELFDRLKESLPAESIHLEAQLDPDDDRLLGLCSDDSPEVDEFLKLCRGWPRSAEEYELFSRRLKYASFLSMFVREGCGVAKTPSARMDEKTYGWCPRASKSMKRAAVV